MTIARATRILAVGIAILLFLLLLGGGFFLYWPTWLSGGYCEITFTQITVKPDGRVDLVYDESIAFGMLEEWMTMPDADGARGCNVHWWSKSSGFLRWPQQVKGGNLSIWVTSFDEEKGKLPGLESFRQRLLLKTGSTYRMRSGDSVVYCRKNYADGRVAEASIRVYPGSR